MIDVPFQDNLQLDAYRPLTPAREDVQPPVLGTDSEIRSARSFIRVFMRDRQAQEKSGSKPNQSSA
jgi:hypothetical protein